MLTASCKDSSSLGMLMHSSMDGLVTYLVMHKTANSDVDSNDDSDKDDVNK